MAVDAKYSLIVEQHVSNACNDIGLLALTDGAAIKALEIERIDATADMGYHSGEDIVACEATGITPYISCPHRGTAIGNGLFPKERFHYDPVADAYDCPYGQVRDCRCPFHRPARRCAGSPGTSRCVVSVRTLVDGRLHCFRKIDSE